MKASNWQTVAMLAAALVAGANVSGKIANVQADETERQATVARLPVSKNNKPRCTGYASAP